MNGNLTSSISLIPGNQNSIPFSQLLHCVIMASYKGLVDLSSE